MNKKKKNMIMIVSVSLIVMLFFGVSYAALTFRSTGTNQELIVGDIWMKYTGTNQIEINNMVPSSGVSIFKTIDLYKYKYNENMTSSEMNTCIEYFTNTYVFGDDETPEAYCNGTGTLGGKTIREEYNLYSRYLEKELVNKNIILLEEKVSSKRMVYTNLEYNTMVSEEDINKCVNDLNWIYYDEETDSYGLPFDEGSTAESYCRGIGTIDGETITDRLNNLKKLTGYNLTSELEDLSFYIALNIVKPVVDMPYFEFKIDGKNTYTKKDIWYDIRLTHGDAHETRNTRINDDNLHFTLIEVDENGNFVDILLSKQKYFDLENKRIWVDRIPANSNNEVNKTYRLYMFVAEDTVIGNKEQDYTLAEWEDVFASIKVNVTGDFLEKELEPTDESCFVTWDTNFYIRNENMTNEELSLCETYFTSFVNENDEYDNYEFNEGTTARTFCEGTGKLKVYGREIYTFQDYLNDARRSEEWNDETKQVLVHLVNNNIIIKESGLEITNYDKNCGGNLVIPSTINNKNVLGINGLSSSNLISITIPTEVRFIEGLWNNLIKKLTIPSSVFYVGYEAFGSNIISDLTIEEGVRVIGDGSFGDNLLTSVDIPSSVYLYYCASFDYDVKINDPNSLTCITIDENNIYSGGNG